MACDTSRVSSCPEQDNPVDVPSMKVIASICEHPVLRWKNSMGSLHHNESEEDLAPLKQSDCSSSKSPTVTQAAAAASSHGETSVSELAKKAKLHVKRSKIPSKPNLLHRTADEKDEGMQASPDGQSSGMAFHVNRDDQLSLNASSQYRDELNSLNSYGTHDAADAGTEIVENGMQGNAHTEQFCVMKEAKLTGIGAQELVEDPKQATLSDPHACDVDQEIAESGLLSIGSNLYGGIGNNSREMVHRRSKATLEGTVGSYCNICSQAHPSQERGFSTESGMPFENDTTFEVLEEPPGFGSGRTSRMHEHHIVYSTEFSNTEEFGLARFRRCEKDADILCSHGHEFKEGVLCAHNHLLDKIPGNNTLHCEQVPLVRCDAEGNLWHIGKRAEESRAMQGTKNSYGLDSLGSEKHSSVHNHSNAFECKEFFRKELQDRLPFGHLICCNWKDDANYSVRMRVKQPTIVKEKSVFVGCIPDCIDGLNELLQSLMVKFLERFDFAPAFFGRKVIVRVGKDFAFLELATEKVAQIVLAANQLDVFEWGVNGYHFNIEGCKSTQTSVRPLIEYIPLKPARVVLIGNVPKNHWKRKYLGMFFSNLLRGSDELLNSEIVVTVILLPESSDAYIEFASDLMADSVIYKCRRCPQLLNEIGEHVFLCRDSGSVPVMSRHKCVVCPQRSLYIGVSGCNQDLNIDSVKKVFCKILPIIARQANQPGYLEYISVHPGQNHAFFQFNSELMVDAIMDEYIENTQYFICRNSSVSYIILRPPGYVRPGALYSCQNIDHATETMHERYSRRSSSEQPGGFVSMLPRRFGDEPSKEPDCIISVGAAPLPLSTWNGLSHEGVCLVDQCMLVLEGLPVEMSCDLVRGALNELFERVLIQTGCLEPGTFVVKHLTVADSDVVAHFANVNVVHALLETRMRFALAGHEIRLLHVTNTMREDMPSKLSGMRGHVSCNADQDAMQMQQDVDSWHYKSNEGFQPCPSPSILVRFNKRTDFNCTAEWHCSEDTVSPLTQHIFKEQLQGRPRIQNNALMQHSKKGCQSLDDNGYLSWNDVGGRMPRSHIGGKLSACHSGFHKAGNRRNEVISSFQNVGMPFDTEGTSKRKLGRVSQVLNGYSPQKMSRRPQFSGVQ